MFSRLSFKGRVLITIVLSCVMCTGLAICVTAWVLFEEGEQALIAKSQAILSRVEVGASYVAQMEVLDSVIAETIQNFPDGQVTNDQKLRILKAVPVFAAFQIGKIGAKEENYEFRIASDTPRKAENKASQEEVEILNRFRNDPDLEEYITTSADGNYIHVTRPVRLDKERGCLNCHGAPSSSPWGNGTDILGYQMEDMHHGTLKGMFTIVSSLEPVKNATALATIEVSIVGAIVTLLALGLGFLMLKGPLGRINLLAEGLSETAVEVANMSSQIASTSSGLASGATQQASALEQTSSSMKQMSAMVSRNSDNAKQSENVVEANQQTAHKGKAIVKEMIQSINEIDQSNADVLKQVERGNLQMAEIAKVISEIGEKTKVINDIVFQTKLLSFNASVEAARAGEQGKGFAVVAEEVAGLAEMSGSAANEITKMLTASIERVDNIVKESRQTIKQLVEVGKEKIEGGTRTAHRCEEVLEEIVESTQSVRSMMREISSGSQEQSKGVNEVNQAMIQLNEVTQQNASASQKSSLASEQLAEYADSLKGSVNTLKETLQGKKAA